MKRCATSSGAWVGGFIGLYRVRGPLITGWTQENLIDIFGSEGASFFYVIGDTSFC